MQTDKLAEKLLVNLPGPVRNRIAATMEAVDVVSEVKNPRVLASFVPSAGRGFLLRQGKSGEPVPMKSHHSALFDFGYKSDFPDMIDLYRRAKEQQWNADTTLDWSIDVDPMNPEVPLLPDEFFPVVQLAESGIHLTPDEQQKLKLSTIAWMLSQFLHGEQGALFAACQCVESVQWTDAKLYGSTQVMDEGRHVEVFHRYIDTKLNKLYQINDNLFVIIDALMTDSRWDMKFLGMQLMVEGLALGAFGMFYKNTSEPLLKNLLKFVIQDEARHVHYGVLALRSHIKDHLSEKERIEREDWAFEVSLLMRNRFMAHEVYEEWFSGILPRSTWNHMVSVAPGMSDFRNIMFSRLVPNLKFIGLLSPRIQRHYEEAGLMKWASGKNASELSADDLLGGLDAQRGQFSAA